VASPDPSPDITREAFRRQRRGRNRWLGLAIAGLCALFFVLAMTKFGATLR